MIAKAPSTKTLVLLCAAVGPLWGALAVAAGTAVIATVNQAGYMPMVDLLLDGARTFIGVLMISLIGAHIVGALPAALGGMLLGTLWPKTGWSLRTTMLASALAGLAASIVLTIVAQSFLVATIAFPVCLFSGAMTWRFTLRRKGPAGAPAVTAEVFG